MLNNERINLRAIEPEDVDKLFLWENDPENWRISHTIAPFSRHELSQYIQSTGDIYSDKQLRLIIELKEEKISIGTLDLFDCDFKNKRTGIGILVAEKNQRGIGIGSSCLELIIPYIFDVLGLHQIYCNVLSDNPESLSLFKKFGFVEIGIKKEWTFHAGNFIDEHLLQLIKPE